MGGGTGSGFSVGGCAVDGASGMFCGCWVCEFDAGAEEAGAEEDCATIAGAAHRHSTTSATSQLAWLHRFPLSAVSMFTDTVRSFDDSLHPMIP
jgi:hypothetical protein